MNMKRTIALVSLGVMLGTASIGGHHAFSAEFDQDKPVVLEGAVTQSGLDESARVDLHRREGSGRHRRELGV